MIRQLSLVALALAGTSLLAACEDQASTGGGGGARSEIRIVGSSTVFPFAKAVAERFKQADPKRSAPVLESTGTGGGIEQFCSGVGPQTPDVANASRRMKKSEFDACQKNGVTDIVEIKIGIDGIAVAQAVNGPALSLTEADLYKALAANPYGKPQAAKSWKDINPAFPAVQIAIFGPPTTSGTRDAFDELIMAKGCDADAATKALKDSDKEKHEAICNDFRRDGAYNEQGENDNLIVQKLVANPDMLGIFGYSYMEENGDKVRGVPINGIKPTYETIANGTYPGARALYIYVKKAHVGKIPGIAEFVQEFVSAGATGSYLSKIGLIAMPDAERATVEATAKGMTALDGAQLK